MIDQQQDNSADASHEVHEVMVREFIAHELEPQAGRAEAKFRQMLAQRNIASTPQAKQPSWRISNRFTTWSIGLVGAALAASLGAIWAGPGFHWASSPAK